MCGRKRGETKIGGRIVSSIIEERGKLHNKSSLWCKSLFLNRFKGAHTVCHSNILLIVLPFALFNYLQQNQTEFKVKFWNKPPIAHTYIYNIVTAMHWHCQIQRISWPAQWWFNDFVFGG